MGRRVAPIAAALATAGALFALALSGDGFDRNDAEALVRDVHRDLAGDAAHDVRCEPRNGRWACRFRGGGRECEATVYGGDQPAFASIC